MGRSSAASSPAADWLVFKRTEVRFARTSVLRVSF